MPENATRLMKYCQAGMFEVEIEIEIQVAGSGWRAAGRIMPGIFNSSNYHSPTPAILVRDFLRSLTIDRLTTIF